MGANPWNEPNSDASAAHAMSSSDESGAASNITPPFAGASTPTAVDKSGAVGPSGSRIPEHLLFTTPPVKRDANSPLFSNEKRLEAMDVDDNEGGKDKAAKAGPTPSDTASMPPPKIPTFTSRNPFSPLAPTKKEDTDSESEGTPNRTSRSKTRRSKDRDKSVYRQTTMETILKNMRSSSLEDKSSSERGESPTKSRGTTRSSSRRSSKDRKSSQEKDNKKSRTRSASKSAARKSKSELDPEKSKESATVKKGMNAPESDTGPRNWADEVEEAEANNKETAKETQPGEDIGSETESMPQTAASPASSALG